MNLCLGFAKENREKKMLEVKAIFEKYINKFTDFNLEYTVEANCHHNYAALEKHYDKNVWVHRKGAVKADKGEISVIPGAMGSYSYIVEGNGNPESFCSYSHGAGRLIQEKELWRLFLVRKLCLI